MRTATRLAPAGLVLLLAGALAGAASPAAAKEVPYLSGRVVDEAGLLPADRAAAIEAQLGAFERETGTQVAVLTVASLEGEVIEDYSHRVAETWALGRAGEDDGVLLLVARDDRRLRIEVGYGLEGRLTDAQSGRIIRDVITPRFREGDFPGGIGAGVDAIVGTLGGDAEAIAAVSRAPAPASGGGCAPPILFLFVVVWILLSLMRGRRRGGLPFILLGGGGGGRGFSGGGGGFSGGGGGFGGGGAAGSW